MERHTLLLFFALLPAVAGTGTLMADSNAGPATVRQSATTDTPQRGATMRQVREAWGTPVDQVPPVGDPPVSRWEYPGFTVYFEHQFVIHTVTGTQRQ